MGIPFLDTVYMGNTLEQYLFAILIVVAFVIGAKVAYHFLRNYVRKVTAKTKTKADDLLVDIVESPLLLLMFVIGLNYGLGMLTFEEGIQSFVSNVLSVLSSLIVVWFVIRIVDVLLKEYLAPLASKSESTLDDEMMPIISKVVKAVILVFAAITIISNFGYDVAAVITGMGIGGIAIALAAKETLGNMFGGFTIFTDRHFKPGDRVRIGSDVYGDVIEVGLRSTRVKTLDNTIKIIPNSIIANTVVENYLQPDHMQKIKMELGVVYSTSSKKMEKGIDIIKKTIKETEGIASKDPIVTFNEFGDSALVILVLYWVKSFDHYLSSKHDINTKIKSRFEKEGIEFAYPSQTIYLEK